MNITRYFFALSKLFSLILAFLTNFKYRFISPSDAFSIFIFLNFAKLGSGFVRSFTQVGYSSRGLAIGTFDCDGSLDFG